jgi:hypothetical protein
MNHLEETRMKFAMILFASAVCYVSLPVKWQVAALAQTSDAEPAPVVAESVKTDSPDDEKKNAGNQPADKPEAETKNADKAETKPTAKSEPAAGEKQAEPAEEKQAEKKKERKTAKAESK